MKTGKSGADLLKIRDLWSANWNRALSLWSPYTKLREPRFCLTPSNEKLEGIHGSGAFAMIRLNDLAVVLSLKEIAEKGLENYSLEIMAHEIGHHVLCPANLSEAAGLAARVRKGLPTREHAGAMVGNLYTDLIINDRLFRQHGLQMDQVYLKASEKTDDPLWNLYMRIYEILWALDKKSLAPGPVTDEMEGDASLAAELIRSYGRDWLRGAGPFAAICLPYIAAPDAGALSNISSWLDAGTPGAGSELPSGFAEMDDDEASGSLHPALNESKTGVAPVPSLEKKSAGKNFREPGEFADILRGLGICASRDEMAARYYRERALPQIVPFLKREVPAAEDPFPEGTEIWDSGSPVDEIDWVESASRSPVIIPGVTALKRVYGSAPGSEPASETVDLDIYVDCSGSMPDPARFISYPCLAGVIICLSALRAGARVQATLWSGQNQFISTGGFISDEKKIMGVLTGYLGGGTAFPLKVLRETYENRRASHRKVHILIISDDGVDTIFDKDNKGRSGAVTAAEALAAAGGGGTMALNLYRDWKEYKALIRASKLGFEIHRVSEMEGLVDFSRSFSRKKYGGGILEKK